MNEMSFLVKTAERPQLQPIVEDLNQYNKRRQIITGIKYDPVRITFYDTIDNLAQQMWSDYASNYFGAFGHDSSRTDYLYDVTIQDQNTGLPFAGAYTGLSQSPTGWGFCPTAINSSNTDVNSHLYFRSISIFEVWGNQYVQYDLINPRITAWAPEGLTYEDAQISQINMTLVFEAVVYVNNGVKQNIPSTTTATANSPSATNAPNLAPFSAAFSSGGEFEGDVLDYPALGAATYVSTYTDYTFAPQSQTTTPYLLTSLYMPPNQSTVSTPYIDTASTLPTSGALSTYGNYVFGTTTTSTTTTNSQEDLLSAVTSNPTLANALSVASSELATSQTGTVATTIVSSPTYNTSTVNATIAAVQALTSTVTNSSSINEPNTSFYQQQLAAGAMSAAGSAGTSAREQIFTQNPAIVQSPNSWDTNSTANSGIALSAAAYGAINEQRPASSQIGFNTAVLRSTSG